MRGFRCPVDKRNPPRPDRRPDRAVVERVIEVEVEVVNREPATDLALDVPDLLAVAAAVPLLGEDADEGAVVRN